MTPVNRITAPLDCLKENPEIQQVTMCCFSGYDKSVYTKALEQITTHEP